MAKSKKGTGRGNVFTKATEARAKQIAQREYGSVDAKGLDLKKLLASVDTARTNYDLHAKKSAINQGVMLLSERLTLVEETRKLKKEETSHKTKVRKSSDAQIRKAEAKKRAADLLRVAAQAEQDAVFQATESLRLFGVMLRVGETGRLVTKSTLDSIDSHKFRAKRDLSLMKPGSDERMDLVRQYIAYSRRFDKLKELGQQTEAEPIELGTLPTLPRDTSEKEKQRRDKQRSLLGGFGKDALSKHAASVQRALTLSGRSLKNGKDNLFSFGDKVVTGFRNGKDVGALTVKSIARVGSGLVSVGRAIKDTGKNTMRWVGDRICGLSRRFFGALQGIKSAMGVSGIGDWLTVGALAAGLMPSLIDGFTTYMKKQYGEDWMSSFINEKWTDTKKYVLEWLEKFVNYAADAIKSIPEKAKEIAEKVKNAAKNVPFVLNEMANPANHTKERNDIKEAQSNGTKTPQEKMIAALSAVQDPKLSSEDRSEAVNEVKRLARLHPYLLEKPAITNRMNQLGIDFTYTNKYGKKINIATHQYNGDPIENTTINKIGSSASSSTLNLNGGRTSVTTPKAPAGGGAPNTSNGPITATPPATSPDSAGTGDSSLPTSPRISGLSNSAIPNQATSDTLNLLNMHGLGMG